MKNLNQAGRLFLAGLICLQVACSPKTNTSGKDKNPETFEQVETSEYIEYEENPPADGFNQEESDQIAVLLADKVMHAMGGRKNWDDLRFLSWNFLGKRNLLWDKHENLVRIEAEDEVIIVNLNDLSGKAWKGDQEITNSEELDSYMEKGRNLWINDSYWLVMPFKLKDPGVRLTYVEEDTTQTGIRSDVIRLTFDNVGVTPQNAYHIWIDIETKLIQQWAYFKNETDETPQFILPWTDYKEYKGVLLSGERGERDITDIKVPGKAPKGAFTDKDSRAF